jgi:hypothetical protein
LPRFLVRSAATKQSHPLCGTRRLSHFVEQRLGLFEIGRVDAFFEPAKDRYEQCRRLLPPAFAGSVRLLAA